MSDFAARVVSWQKALGRHNLPWQNTRDPYRVWLSEVMLQQTQVATVLGYFQRFVARWPDVGSLAQASPDEVMGLWSGLGYYSRARNLHQCAQDVMRLHAGVFPQSAQQLQRLPGIGRSTAAAIASLCFGERVAILDGNVRRVLTRVLGFDADLSVAANEKSLWEQAQRLLPVAGTPNPMQHYTQGMMDLGATLCTSRSPECTVCPLADLCVARACGEPERYPVKSRKLKRSGLQVWLLWAKTSDGMVWMKKRPEKGIWAGLYCFPWFDSREALLVSIPADCHATLQETTAFTHVLTHRDLTLHPIQMQLSVGAHWLEGGEWVAVDVWLGRGLPAPIRKLLLQG